MKDISSVYRSFSEAEPMFWLQATSKKFLSKITERDFQDGIGKLMRRTINGRRMKFDLQPWLSLYEKILTKWPKLAFERLHTDLIHNFQM